jgi:hypothetical protein
VEDLGGLRCRGDAEHGPAGAAQILGGGAQGGGLAGTGGADDEDEAIVSGDGCSGAGLEDVEVLRAHGGRR